MTRARGAELLASATRSRTEPAPDGAGTAGHRSPAYRRVEGLLSAQECVILDGGIATELEELEIPGYELRDDAMWGIYALLMHPRPSSRSTAATPRSAAT